MSYCIVHGQPVFLYSSLYKLIQERTSKTRDDDLLVFGSAADIREGKRESRRVGRTVYDFLRKQWEADPVHFHTNWASFDINGEDAVRDVWDLLNDYCDYYGYGYLPDLRNAVQQLTEGFTVDRYGQSKVPLLALNHLVKPPKWWWRFTRKTDGRVISLVIVTKNVCRLVGDMKNFAVFTTDFRLNCGPNFGIYPVAKEKEPGQPQ